MGQNILPGQVLTGGQAAGQLNQYYGLADTTQTTVTAAALANLSSVYTIPAGEAYADSAYELECGGSGQWGSTVQNLYFVAALNGATIHTTTGISGNTLSASAFFVWGAKITLVSSDGISLWFATLKVQGNQYGALILPGAQANGEFTLADSTPGTGATATVASPITVAVQAKWNATTGAPSLTNLWTTFRKVA